MAVVLLAWWPLRGTLAGPGTMLLGTAIDSVHHAWGLWYVAEGAPSDTFWPVGAYGTVIGGPSVLVGALLARLVGAAGAYTATCALQVALALVGTGLLAERLGGGRWSAPTAALLLLAGRPLLAQIGWGVPEGAAIGWLALALVGGLGPERATVGAGAALRGVVTGALLAASVVENPYTLPLVVVVGAAFAVARVRAGAVARLFGEAAGGVGVLGAWLVFAHGDSGSLAAASVGHSYQVLGRTYLAEGWDGRAHVDGLLRSWPPLRYDGARQSELLAEGASDALGWVPVVLALVAAARLRPARLACLAGVALVVLALGSFPGGDEAGIPGPFLYVNLLIGLVVRPLTQPVRYLVLAGAALAVAGGLLVGAWVADGRRWLAGGVIALATLEAVTLGSPATRIPTFDLGTWQCVASLDDGPVATQLGAHPFETVGAAALALQMVHGAPGTHHAIGGWAPRAERSKALADALARLASPVPAPPAVRHTLAREGVRWLVVDETAAPARARSRVCGGLAVVDMHMYAIPGSREGQQLPVPR